MAANTGGTVERRRPSGIARLLRLAAAFVVLLALSEILWLWQTWPVRALLQAPPSATPVASGR